MSQYPTNLFSTNEAAIEPLELTVSGPGWDGERHILEQPFVLVGRDERSGLRLEDEAVSRRHAYLQRLGERIFCIDLGSRTGTRWAGASRPAGWLHPNEGIQIGPFALEIANAAWAGAVPSEPGAEAGDPLQDRINDQPHLPRFSIAVGNEVQSQFRMNRELVLVGSSPDCRVRLRDAGVSRFHCSLVRMPGGVWVIDLLSTTGTRLNGQPIRYARLNEGDLVRVGQYLLRLGYEGEGTPRRATVLPAHRPEAAAPKEDDTSKSELMPELEQLRERLRDMETLRQQLADRDTECDRLREQGHTIDKQTAELSDLKTRLEVAETVAGKLEEVCSERDHWQTQTHGLQTQIASGLAERADLHTQLETAKRQLAQESENLCATKVQLDQQSAALQQLQVKDGELARERDRTRELQAELDQARGHQQDAEALRHQLADARNKHDELIVRVQELDDRSSSTDRLQDRLRNADAETEQLRQQIRGLEIQVAEMPDLKGQFESAAGKLEDVCRQRDHWQTEAHSLRTQVESGLAEREELRQRFEAAQRQLTEEHEAVRTANVQLEQQSAALQQLEEAHAELARERDKTCELREELDRAREHQQNAEAFRQQLEDSRSNHDELVVRALELEGKAATADHLQDRLRNADVEAEQLRQQIRGLEIQAAEAANLKRQLESSETDASNLREVGSERDRWQSEAQVLGNQIASGLAEREELRQRLAEVQQQLAGEREAVRVANLQLEQQSTALQADAEALRHQLGDARNKHGELASRVLELEGAAGSADHLASGLRERDVETERLRQRVRVLEIGAAEAVEIEERLEAAEGDARNLEEVRSERDRWQVEAQTLRNRISSDLVEREQFVRLTEELLAVQAERDRLLEQQQRSSDEVKPEMTSTSEEAFGEERSRWESERQTLEALIEQARTADHESAKARVREVQGRAAAEREEWKVRLEGAEAQIVWERGLLQEQTEQLRRQVSALQAERDRLAARLAQTAPVAPAAQDPSREKAARPVETNSLPQMAVQDRALAMFCGIEMGHSFESSARAQGANKPAEPARPRVPSPGEWSQGGQQIRLSSIEQGVEDAWMQAAAEQKGPIVPADAGQASNPPDAAQGIPAILEEGKPEEVSHAWLSQPKEEERPGLLRKILNLVRGK